MGTAISYADKVWPVTAGCTAVSAACEGCWACRLAATRQEHHPDYRGLARRTDGGHYQWSGEVRLLPHHLDDPLHWRRPRVVFVDSQSDLFHESVPDDFIAKVWLTMARCPQHQFIVLTKRPERMMEMATASPIGWHFGQLPNIVLGVTAENQEEADRRIPILLQTPAAKRWVSLEPLLQDLGEVNLDGISWAVIGCESGPNARSMPLDWVRFLRDQCVAVGVKFYFKQCMSVVGKLIHLPELDGRQWLEVPW